MRTGIAIFHSTVIVLLSARNFTPMMLTTVKSSISSGEEQAREGQGGTACVQQLEVVLHPVDVVEIRQAGLDLDRRDGDRLQPGSPPGGVARQRAEGEVGERAVPPATG